MNKLFAFIISLSVLLLLHSCGSSNTSQFSDKGDELIGEAHNLRMSELSDGLTLVTIRNPWDTTATMARYLLIEKGATAPSDLPEDVVKIQVPIDKSIVYSGVYATLIDELGAGDAVTGLCDVEYVRDNKINAAIKAGKIADCGNSQSPNIEKIVTLRPKAVLLSPYENNDGSEQYKRTGLPVVFTADYMESTPLGRAEWMRFYGRLYGRAEAADSLYSDVKSKYTELSRRTKERITAQAALPQIPVVLFDRTYSGVWSVPTSGSVTGHLIEDAGGRNPFGDYNNSGSAQLSVEEVVHKAADSDIWLIRYYEPSLSLKQLRADNPAYAKIKAFKTGNVYGANTLEKPLFEDGAFHPHLVLEEMIKLFHPELLQNADLRYYEKIKP